VAGDRESVTVVAASKAAELAPAHRADASSPAVSALGRYLCRVQHHVNQQIAALQTVLFAMVPIAMAGFLVVFVISQLRGRRKRR
jgi:hypothetical protein